MTSEFPSQFYDLAILRSVISTDFSAAFFFFFGVFALVIYCYLCCSDKIVSILVLYCRIDCCLYYISDLPTRL